MAIKDQFANVFSKTGVIFTRQSGSGEDYLDVELSSGTTWRGRFVRKCSLKTGSIFSNGEVLVNSQDSLRYLLTNIQHDFLVNEAIFQQGELFRCNVSGEISHFVSGERTSYKKTGSFIPLYSGEYFCLVPNRLDLVEREPALNLVDTMYMYSPESLNVQVDHRVTIFNPTIQNYRVKTVDCLSMEGIKIVELETDKR